tara:strand:- start:389 stop:643 length:255 start_codon:yes stop_codon:yes gene_type:complete
MIKPGKETSEWQGFNFVKVMGLVLPVVALVCDLLVNNGIFIGSAAAIAGMVSTAIASAGYSQSRARVKSSEAMVEGLKKKSEKE